MNKQIVTNLIIVPTTGAEAYAAMEPEIRAVPDDTLVKINIDIPHGHQIVITAAAQMERHLPQLVMLAFFDMDLVYKIRLIADACRHAHLLAMSPETTDPRAPALVQEGAALRALMLGAAELLALFGYVPEATVVAIRAGSGNIDMTNDLEQLEVLYRQLPADVIAKTPVTETMIQRSGTLASELCRVFGIRQFGARNGTDDRQLMRQKAFTLLVRAYDECRRGIAFLRAPYGDADEITPSLFLRKKRSTSTDVEPDVEAVEGSIVEPAPAAPPVNGAATNVMSPA